MSMMSTPFGNHLLRVAQGCVAPRVLASVGERIGRDVQDAHHQRAAVAGEAASPALEELGRQDLVSRNGKAGAQGTGF